MKYPKHIELENGDCLDLSSVQTVHKDYYTQEKKKKGTYVIYRLIKKNQAPPIPWLTDNPLINLENWK